MKVGVDERFTNQDDRQSGDSAIFWDLDILLDSSSSVPVGFRQLVRRVIRGVGEREQPATNWYVNHRQSALGDMLKISTAYQWSNRWVSSELGMQGNKDEAESQDSSYPEGLTSQLSERE